MLDVIKMTYEEYSATHNNVHYMLLEDSGKFPFIFKTEEIALPAFELNVDGKMVLNYFYNKKAKILRVQILNQKNRFIEFTADNVGLDLSDAGVTFHIKYNFKNEGDQMWWQARCQTAQQTPFAVAADLASQFFVLNFYLRDVPTVVKTVENKVEETYLEKKKGNKRYKTRVVLQKTIYIHAKEYKKSEIKRFIKCLCWGVRGHFRYLKSGKAVWVRPYRKGKERNNEAVYAEKEYVL